MSASPQSHPVSRVVAVAGATALLACAALGLFARFHALGERQLAVDEYYTLTSVGHILERGVPAFPDGGYYTRDLPGQYLTAASVLLFGDSGFAKRLPPALFGLACVALLYVYARPQLGRTVAAALAAVLLVSSWEVEFSRFARMYAGFQCATLAFLIAYERALLGSHWNRRYLAHAAGIVMVLFQDLGVFLLPLLFVPLLIESRAGRFPSRPHAVRHALASAATLLACLAHVKTDLRFAGASDPYPSGFVPAGHPLLRAADLPFWRVSADPSVILMVLIAALALSAIIPAAVGACRARRDWASLGLAGLMLASTALHSFVISAACALVLVFRHDAHRSGPSVRGYRAVLATSAGIAAAWLGYALLTPGWMSEPLERGGSLVGALRRAFFGWPDFYTPIALPWASALPEIGALIALALAHQLWTNRKQPLAILARNPALPVLIAALALGAFDSRESGTRYAFFVYPVGLYTVALSAVQITRAILPRAARADMVAAALFTAAFALSSDFSPRHLIDIAGPEASFRIGRFAGRDAVWYPRYDYKSSAEFLEANATPGKETRIIASVLPPLSQYLELDHAVFYPRGRAIFKGVSREGGTRELWSQRRLLSTDEDLREYTADAETIWLVQHTEAERQPFLAGRVWEDRMVAAERRFLSHDRRVEVLELTLRPDAAAR